MADPLISVVIVNFKVPQLIVQLLRSMRDAQLYDRSEIIVVDNASGDNSQLIVCQDFPEVTWIGLKSNIGFGKACNVGGRRAQGQYLLLINPDTIVSRNTLDACTDFLDSHPSAGMVGPKILNTDGTLQASCRRSFPSPSVAFYHFSGLSRLFPSSEKFGRYNLTFMDPDTSAPVDAVSGSFMFMRRELFIKLGGFDEQFFMYGEDIDLCRRVREEGSEVWYHPQTQIVHFKGKSSAKRSLRSRAAFYEAMVLFSRKYSRTHESFLPGWLILVGIAAQAVVHLGMNVFKSLTATFIDVFLINAILWAGITVRFSLAGMDSPYTGAGTLVMVCMHCLLSSSFLWTFFYRGVYARKRYSARNTFMSGLVASMMFMACVYFIQSMAFSRISFAVSSLVISLVLVGWRELLPLTATGIKRLMFARDRIVVLGSGEVARLLVRNVENERTGAIAAVVWPDDTEVPGDFEGYPVVGTIDTLANVLSRYHADILLVATARPWYSFVIDALGSSQVKKLTVRWVPLDILSRNTSSLPDRIPLQDFTV